MLRWEGSVKIDLQETGWLDVDWIDLAQDRDQRRALVFHKMLKIVGVASEGGLSSMGWFCTAGPTDGGEGGDP
jgi:hypothetical protein